MDGMVATSEKSALLGAACLRSGSVHLHRRASYGALTSAKLLAHLIISDACLDMYEDRQTERLRRTIDTYALVVATGAFKTKTPTYRGIRGVGAAGRLRKHDDIAGKQPSSNVDLNRGAPEPAAACLARGYIVRSDRVVDHESRVRSMRGAALIVQDRLGGELMHDATKSVSHYWNRLANGFEIDLTSNQFETEPHFDRVETRSRDYVLSYHETKARYEKMLRRVVALAP